MKILVVGSGGREHALAWRLAQSPGLQKVYVAPGNAGTAREHELENLALTDIEALADWAAKEKVHATVVGPEAPLAAGIVEDDDIAISGHIGIGELDRLAVGLLIEHQHRGGRSSGFLWFLQSKGR